MTFSCPNYDVHTEMCRKVNALCVPGRTGCVLAGKVTFSEDLQTRIQRAEERAAKRMRKHRDTTNDSGY